MESMTAEKWKNGRRSAGLTQSESARALRISQPYLSQLETGTRVAPPELESKAVELYGLPLTDLPLTEPRETQTPDDVHEQLAALGYPGFAHVRFRAKMNPASVVLGAVVMNDLDTRLVEALPWVLLTYPNLDWPWLRDRVKLRNAQNRLGYLVHLAKGLAGDNRDALGRWEQELEEARLAREGTLCSDSMPNPERLWVRTHRPAAAAHWKLLTDLSPEQLPYADL